LLPAIVPPTRAATVQTAHADLVPHLPAIAPRSDGPAGNLQSMHRLAAERYAGLDSYIVTLTRHERVGGKDRPEEVLLFKFRQSPSSVYLKWVGAEGRGRELVYSRGQYGDKVHLLTAAGDPSHLPFGGQHLSLALDDPALHAKSRHSVTELGFGPLIERFGALVEADARGDSRGGSLKYLGMAKRAECPDMVEGALQAIPAGQEPGLSKGGQRWWFFDPQLHLPVLVYAQDEKGQVVEYYCYQRILFPARPLGEEEFNPEALWGR
jgi:hypothetical protein